MTLFMYGYPQKYKKHKIVHIILTAGKVESGLGSGKIVLIRIRPDLRSGSTTLLFRPTAGQPWLQGAQLCLPLPCDEGQLPECLRMRVQSLLRRGDAQLHGQRDDVISGTAAGTALFEYLAPSGE